MNSPTPPYSSLTTPEPPNPQDMLAHPTTPSSTDLNFCSPTFYIPHNLTQDMVLFDPLLKRLQQDLLILTSLNDNSTLSWRPSWFKQPDCSVSIGLWTLYNPPNVVTEHLPMRAPPLDRQITTRRMREIGDPEPMYMRNEQKWVHYCARNGIPWDFLCEDQIRLLRLGLCRDEHGRVCAPPSWPLYPEPQPLSQEDYILHTDTHAGLVRKFHHIESEADAESGRCIVVRPSGAVEVKEQGYTQFARIYPLGKRWSYLPWTEEQEWSCRPMTLKLRFWNTAREVEKAE